jgi:hypothetical protein
MRLSPRAELFKRPLAKVASNGPPKSAALRRASEAGMALHLPGTDVNWVILDEPVLDYP